MSLSEQDRRSIAEDVAAKVAAAQKPSAATGWIKTAGDAVGMVAGVVALGYFIGAAVVALRMFIDKFNPDEVAAVIGELPRETVITLGFIEGVSVAAAFGLLIGSLAAVNDLPSRPTDPPGKTRSEKEIRRLGVAFATVCLVGIVGYIFYEGWHPNGWLVILLVPVLMSWAVAHLGARRLVKARERAPHHKGALTALVVTAFGIPLCVMFGPIVGFPDARVCQQDGTEFTGSLIADTGDRIVLIRQTEEQRKDDSARTVDAIPAGLVARLDYGDIDDVPPCVVPPPARPG